MKAFVAIVSFVLLSSASAQAEPAEHPAPLTSQRELPNLDGRDPAGPGVGEALLWIPRVALFPLYLVTEYGLRWPLGKTASALERYHVIDYAKEIVTFRDGTIGVFPTFRIDRGLAPTVGLYSYADGVFTDSHKLKLTGDTDSERNHTVVLLNRFRLDDELDLNLRTSLEQRDDFVFYGTGSRTSTTDESRFGRRKLMAVVEVKQSDDRPGFDGRASLEVSDNQFFCADEDERDLCATGNRPTGFTDGYQLMRLKMHGSLDSRSSRPTSGSGVRLDLFGRYAHGVGSASSDIHFLRYGGEASAYLDVNGGQRVLGLRVMAEMVEPIGGSEVPFAELITLGGMETMRGFLHARFHGASAVVATLDYRYPVWSLVDGNIFVEVGNTFDHHFDDFSLESMRGVAGFALRTNASRNVSMDFLVAVGSTPLGEGDLGVDFVRVSLGTNLGF